MSGLLGGSTTGPASAKATCNVTGNVDRPVCKAKLKFDTDGTITGPGVVCDAVINGRVNGPIDSDGFFEGKGRAKLDLDCPGERFRRSVAGLFEYTVDPPTPWSLTVQVSPNGRKLEGTAVDSLGFTYTAKGRNNEKKDESQISLKGDKDTVSKGAKIRLKNLVTTGSSVTGGTAKISVQGTKSEAELGP